MLSIEAVALLRLLRRWSVGSIGKFAEEMHLTPQVVEKATIELTNHHLIQTFEIADDCAFHNRMLEIRDKGISFLEEIDGPVDTFPDKAT